MHNEYGITRENLLRTLPQSVIRTESEAALADVTAEELAKRAILSDLARIYARIDELPEEVLDILAVDFKVDWWDGEYSLEEKRETLKRSWAVHRTLGTKAAVEMAISAIFEGTKISEWFEYGGRPHYFRLLVNAAHEDIEPEKYARVLERVTFYKNLAAKLDGIEYIVDVDCDATMRIGGYLASVSTIGLPELADELTFDDAVRVGGRVSTVATLTIPAIN